MAILPIKLPVWLARNQESDDAASFRAAEKRLSWADSRAVFRMPEATDDKLEQMRVLRSATDERYFNVALEGVLRELKDPDRRAQRLAIARKLDIESASETLVEAINLHAQGTISKLDLREYFIAKATFFCLTVTVDQTESIQVLESATGLEILAFSRPDWLRGERSELAFSEKTGTVVLEQCDAVKCDLIIDRGQAHQFTLKA